MKRFNGVITAAALLGGALVAESPLFAAGAAADTDAHCTQASENSYSSAVLRVTCTYDEAGEYHVAVPADADTTEVDAVGGHGAAPNGSDFAQNPSSQIHASYGLGKQFPFGGSPGSNPFAGQSLDITVGGNANGSTGGSNGGGDGGPGAGGGGGRTEVSTGTLPMIVAPGGGGSGGGASGPDGVGGSAYNAPTAGAMADGESTDAVGGSPGQRGASGVGGLGGSPSGSAGGAAAGGAGGDGCNGGGGGGAGYGGGGGGGAGSISDLGNCSGGGGGAGGDSLVAAGSSFSYESVVDSNTDPRLIVSWTIPLTIDDDAVPAGTVGEDYSFKFETNMPDATFDVYAGSLPDGLTLAADGTLSGTPTTTDNSPSNFTVRARDTNNVAVYRYVSLPVNAAPDVVFTNGTVPDGTVGQQYSFNFTASDCPGCSFGTTSGQLPDGLTLAADGTLSGTPTSDAKAYSFTVTATADDGRTADYPATVTVAKATPAVSVVYTPRNMAAKVAGADGGPVPTGSVRFEVDGKSIGSLALKNGAVVKPWLIPAGGAHTYRVYYSGDTKYLPAPSVLRDRKDPTITIEPDRDSNPDGWYRTPVTLYSHCSITTAELTKPCPAPVTLSTEVAGKSVTRTVYAKDGGSASATISGINIDRTAPTAQLSGLDTTATYTAKTRPTVTCTASDALSGLNGECVVSYKIGGGRITYTGVATDVAGNVRRVTISARYR